MSAAEPALNREPVETIEVPERELSCDGGDGPLGHPRVYLTMERDGQIDCPYCGRRFIYNPNVSVRRIVSSAW